ncbi:hypothetical protein NUU61_006415 [Penicillium alfredii]|uniref:Uncharacterized protein n=1 Tax=Penicillium alfredii TaxID=1506179 RepID=A0A9W9K3L7_9EURO|nr:uncharacterized protein NUU61_006415 [Penicillium alfredii]KAJ5091545.1 hypothetical protein NUU61_006415 [Penicillium alfredii]
MSSGMKLRRIIRAPTRYGEEAETPTLALLQAMRNAREDPMDGSQEPVELLGKGVRVRRQKPRPPIVPFDPNLPPAAFPSLDRPRLPQDSHALEQNGQDTQQKTQEVSRAQQNSQLVDDLDHVLPDVVDNYLASNTAANPIYARNMAIMAGMDEDSVDETLALEDSDNDEVIDASEVLKNKISNPKWSDLNPAIQLEIVENLLQTFNWRDVCHRLQLNMHDRKKFSAYLDTRNQQIARENKVLQKMRDKQLRALMRIDNSDLRSNHVPYKLVLRKITRSTLRAMVESESTDLLMCQAADVLAAREFLRQRGISRSYAGDWGHSLVVLRKREDQGPEPEKFEWKENLCLSPELSETEKNTKGAVQNPATEAKTYFIQSIGKGSTVNPTDLIRNSGDEEPILDWSKYFPGWHPLEVPKPKRQTNEFVRLSIGAERAAQIHRLEQSRTKAQDWSPHRPTPDRSSPPEYLEETPSKIWDDFLTHGELEVAISQSLPQSPPEPVTRSLGGRWSLNALDPAIGQARFQWKMKQAQLESRQQKAEKASARVLGKEQVRDSISAPAGYRPGAVQPPSTEHFYGDVDGLISEFVALEEECVDMSTTDADCSGDDELVLVPTQESP